jgi:hypothetical protein
VQKPESYRLLERQHELTIRILSCQSRPWPIGSFATQFQVVTISIPAVSILVIGRE